jgi:hypothetical protein
MAFCPYALSLFLRADASPNQRDSGRRACLVSCLGLGVMGRARLCIARHVDCCQRVLTAQCQNQSINVLSFSTQSPFAARPARRNAPGGNGSHSRRQKG